MNEVVVPVEWMPVKGTHEFTIIHDGKTVATIQQDCYDEEKTIFTESYRIISADSAIVKQMREGAKNYPELIKIIDDGETVKAEVNRTVVAIDMFATIRLCLYPWL